MTADQATLAIAASICDSQELTMGQRLGGGTFKTVVEVVREGHPYALKVIKAPGASARVLREIEAARSRI